LRIEIFSAISHIFASKIRYNCRRKTRMVLKCSQE